MQLRNSFSCHTRETPRSHLAFSLIELLVVISIVAVLISIMLPALGGIKRSAQQVLSASNMRQIGLAIQMFQDDHNGWFPQTTHGSPNINQSWIYTLAPYLSDAGQVEDPDNPGETIWEIGEVRICPRDPKAEERMANSASSYMLNEWVAVPYVGPFGGIDQSQSYTRRERLKRPSGTHVLFVAANRWPASTYADHTHSRSWNDWSTVTWDISTDRYGANGSPQFLDGSSNYLFADGHVEGIQAPTLKKVIDDGVNFSRPPE
jgi:prepilin-type processing-associated H-X9-DG protein/prepilin-type N-terminal cleavage/methylation domain-containing protein